MVVEKGYAKLNLGLRVLGKRSDDYHELDMVMCNLNLYDELYFKENDTGKIRIECEKLNHIKLENNLVYKVASLLKSEFNIKKGVDIRLVKRIPEQAGLGGGSADAAAAFRGLNKLWNLGLSTEELHKLSLQIGSDVAYLIYNKTARVKGRGDIIEFIDPMPYCHVVLVYPGLGFSTKSVFSNIGITYKDSSNVDKLVDAIKDANYDEITSSLFNDLEVGVNPIIINDMIKDLKTCGALHPQMTGSGSIVYALCQNEKAAKVLAGKYKQLIKQKVSPRNYEVLLTQVRSNRPFNKETKVKTLSKDDQSDKITTNKDLYKNPVKDKILATTTIHAYGMIPLAYEKNLDDYRIILSPVSYSERLTINKTSDFKVKLIGDALHLSTLKGLATDLEKLTELLGYGLEVFFPTSITRNSSLITSDNYLANIINALSEFGGNPTEIFKLFSNELKNYQGEETVYYESKTDTNTFLGKAVFAHVLIVPLNIKNYASPRHTKQLITNNVALDEVMAGIKEHNFYKTATNAYNGIEDFEISEINFIKGKGFLEELKDKALNSKISHAYLSLDGKNLILLARFEKHLDDYLAYLRRRFTNVGEILTTFKSDVPHQNSKSKILKDISIPDRQIVIKDIILNVDLGIKTIDAKVKEDVLVKDRASIKEEIISEKTPYTPWAVPKEEVSGGRIKYSKKPKSAKGAPRKESSNYEGLLYVQSGGSIFKGFDFIDIAHYFEAYFKNKYIEFKGLGEDLQIEFKTSSLPHILGLHLIDEGNKSLNGYSGYQKLLDGEIRYDDLKKSSKISQETLNNIIERTSSSLLIFNDIYHERLYNIYCFPREKIVSRESKMDQFKFAITRRLSSSSFKRQNLLGVGVDSTTNHHFFLTSFIYDLPPGLSKKDSLDISIAVHK